MLYLLRRAVASIGLGFAMVIPACEPAAAQDAPYVKVGEPVMFFTVCQNKETAESFANMMSTTGSYTEAQRLLQKRVAEGECVLLPQWSSAPAEELGQDRLPFVDEDGDMMEVRAVRVKNVWTISLRVVKEAKRT